MKDKLQGSALLLLTTLIWGASFVAQSVGMDHVGPFTFQAVRCAMAFIGLLPIIFIFDLKNKEGKKFFSKFFDKKLLLAGLLCGFPLCVATNLQQVGLISTDAGKGAFLTSLYIVFTPIIGLFFKRKLTIMTPISVVIAVIGLYCMSCVGVSGISQGDLVMIGCAVCFAVQIVMVDRFGTAVDGLRLNCLQALICCVFSAIVMAFTETPSLGAISDAMIPLSYSGFLSMGAAYTLQILGQKKLDATPAALIMSMESVFATIFGMLLLNERLSSWEAAGCVLMFIAVILSQIPFPQKKKETVKQ